MQQLWCPHCEECFKFDNPFEYFHDPKCLVCGKSIYIELYRDDEGNDIYVTYKEDPGYELQLKMMLKKGNG